MNEGVDEVNAYLDARLAAVNRSAGDVRAEGDPVEPTPAPDPTPAPGEPSPTPSPTPTPLAVQDDALIALVEQVHAEQVGTRVATSGSFQVLCLLLMLSIAALAIATLRRRG